MLTPPSEPAVDPDATRRAFLTKVAAGGVAAALGTQVLPVGGLRAFAQEGGESEEPAVALTPDEERVTFLAGIGLAAAAGYRAATGDEATGEDDEEPSTTTLPPITVPPLAEPVVEILRVFGSHHAQQATALGGLLATAPTEPNGALLSEVRGRLGSAGDEAEVLGILRDLEERIAATHLQAIADIEDTNDAKLVATALPVVGQHVVVLGRAGASPAPLEELVPEEQATDGALDEATYPADGTTAPPGGGDPADEDANPGGGGADPDTDGGGQPDGTDSSGGGATDGTDTGAGGAADPESEG